MATTQDLRIAVVMVGLPARGKTFIAHKVRRYLTWLGINTNVFNVGNYRRERVGPEVRHTFFQTDNEEGMAQRQRAAKDALKDMLQWFDEGGTVAIYDGTNGTKARRSWLYHELTSHHIEVLFVESICEDKDIILKNIKDVKLTAPEYVDIDPDVAAEDFRKRIEHYQAAYETICEKDEDEYTYIKMINVGSQYIINRIRGYLESKIVAYLMNLHIRPKRIWFSRHGESMFNVQGKIGGDADLSPRGQQYAAKLPDLIKRELGDRPLTVWTSSMKRTIQTAQNLKYPKLHWKALDELDTGVCDGMTYEEIEEKYPEDFARRDEDKFNYRYRGGESYRDLVLRLEPVIMELERHENILIIAHQATIRCMYAYFMNMTHDELPYAPIPLHTVIELTPKAYGCTQRLYKVDIEAVNTYRPRVPQRISQLRESEGQKQSGLGASGEIADSAQPILPLSPKLIPKNPSTPSPAPASTHS